MQREDMFSWFKRKPKDTKTAVDASAPAAAPSSSPAKDSSAPAITPTPAPAVQPVAAAPAIASDNDVADAMLLKDIGAVLRAYDEPEPSVGMQAIELASTRLRNAEVVNIQANGRRVLARIENTARPYTYTLRKDGTYRLEGAPVVTGARLVLGVEI